MNQPINLVLLMLVLFGAAIAICAWMSPDYLTVLSRKCRARAEALRVYRARLRVAECEYRDAYEQCIQRSLMADGADLVKDSER